MIYTFVDNETSLGLPIEAKEKDGRCLLLDNVRFMCIVMVVLHHTHGCHDSFGFSRKFIPQPWGGYFFAVVSPTHTRTFCFISGMLSRGNLKADKIFSSLVAPLLGFCFIIAPLVWLTDSVLYAGIPRNPSKWFNPLLALFAPNVNLWWYLGALIWWRILGSLIKSFPAYGRLLLACLLGAMVTYAKTPVLHLIWLRYFPNFVAGQLFPYDQVVSKLRWHPMSALLGMAVLYTIAKAKVDFDPDHSIFYDSPPADNLVLRTVNADFASPFVMPLLWLPGLANTSLELLKSIILVFVVCPREEYVFTSTGQHSLYPYLLQGFALSLFGKANVLTPWLKQGASIALPWKLAVVIVDFLVVALFCMLMASWPVRSIFSFILEPTWIGKLYVKK